MNNTLIDISVEALRIEMAMEVVEESTALDIELEAETGEAAGVVTVAAPDPLFLDLTGEADDTTLEVEVGRVYLSEHYLTKQTVQALPKAGDPNVVYQLSVGSGEYYYFMWIGSTFVPFCHFTAADKEKLDGIEAGAQVNVKTDWNAPAGTAAELLNKPELPDAPGTLKTDNTTAQTPQASEPLSGTVNLHKVAKTGSYNDLLDKPTLNLQGGLKVYLNGVDVTNNANVQTLNAASQWFGTQAQYDELADGNLTEQGTAYYILPQPDWDEGDAKKLGKIRNKPDLVDYSIGNVPGYTSYRLSLFRRQY